jgi:hypothetical protein
MGGATNLENMRRVTRVYKRVLGRKRIALVVVNDAREGVGGGRRGRLGGAVRPIIGTDRDEPGKRLGGEGGGRDGGEIGVERVRIGLTGVRGGVKRLYVGRGGAI